jgi:ankyrin repeat protein
MNLTEQKIFDQRINNLPWYIVDSFDVLFVVKNKLTGLYTRIIDIELGMLFAGQYGDMELIDVLSLKIQNKFNIQPWSTYMYNIIASKYNGKKYNSDCWTHGLYGSSFSGDIQTTELMLANGAGDLNYMAQVACLHGRTEIVKILLDKGAKITCFSELDCPSKHIDVCELLSARGLLPVRRGLMIACQNGSMLIARTAIDKIIKHVNSKSFTQYGAFDQEILKACDNNHNDIVELLISRCSEPVLRKAMAISCGSCSIECVLLLINHGINPSMQDLTICCETNNNDIICLVLKEYQYSDSAFYTINDALSSICTYGSVENINLIINAGATDYNAGLVGACLGGRIKNVELMIEKKANSWVAGLCAARDSNHPKIVSMMLNKMYDEWSCANQKHLHNG